MGAPFQHTVNMCNKLREAMMRAGQTVDTTSVDTPADELHRADMHNVFGILLAAMEAVLETDDPVLKQQITLPVGRGIPWTGTN